MRFFVKREKKDVHKCLEPCPFVNSQELLDIHKETEGHHYRSLTMIGSGYCQRCEHHKNSNLIESIGKDYDVNKHGGLLSWIECDKLKE
jgi:hypothetical protein